MKITYNILIAVLAGVALSVVSSSAQSVGYRARGDDGITASPKLRQRLDEYNRNHNPAPAVEIPQMPCAKCKDVVTNVPDLTSRGLGARTLMAHGVPTKAVVSHLCQGCGVDWKIVGVGKAKKSVATHTCTSCGAETLACCNTTKGSDVATKGMEKNFEVAPLK